MLNAREIAVLKVVNDILESGRYEIIGLDELCSALSSGMSKDDVLNSLTVLKTYGYVFIKYLDEEEVCLSISDKGRNYLEAESIDKKTDKKEVASFRQVFFGSFLGSFFALLLAFLFYIIGAKCF